MKKSFAVSLMVATLGMVVMSNAEAKSKTPVKDSEDVVVREDTKPSVTDTTPDMCDMLDSIQNEYTRRDYLARKEFCTNMSLDSGNTSDAPVVKHSLPMAAPVHTSTMTTTVESTSQTNMQ